MKTILLVFTSLVLSFNAWSFGLVADELKELACNEVLYSYLDYDAYMGSDYCTNLSFIALTSQGGLLVSVELPEELKICTVELVDSTLNSIGWQARFGSVRCQ